MNSKNKILVLLSSALLAAGVTATVSSAAIAQHDLPFGIHAADACTSHEGNHYVWKDPTNTESGWKEFWACCVCGRQYLTQENGTWTNNDAASMIGVVDSEHVAYLPAGLKTPMNEDDWGLKPLSQSFAKTDYVGKSIQFKAYFEDGDCDIQITLYNGNDEYSNAISDIKLHKRSGVYNATFADARDLEAEFTPVDEHTVTVKINYNNLLEAGAIGTEEYFNYIRVWPMASVTTPGCGVFTNSFEIVAPTAHSATYTYDTTESIVSGVSVEGRTLSVDKYGVGYENGICTLDPAGTHPDQAANGYLVFNDLKGITDFTVRGTGKIAMRSGTAAWSWKTTSVMEISPEGLTVHLDPERDNALLIGSAGAQVVVNSVEINTTGVVATGSTDNDILQNTSVLDWGVNSFAYFSSAETNGSASALVVGSYQQTMDWPPVQLNVGNIDCTGFNLALDAKHVVGKGWVSVTPYDSSDNPLGTEKAFETTDSWQSFIYDAWTTDVRNVSRIRIGLFTTADAPLHMNVIDNFRLIDDSIVTESNVSAWSYRSFNAAHTYTEAQYFDKALAIDFKPETASASFELDYMSSADHYVGRKNYINVTDGVPTSTFGTITANPSKGAGWYTLTVSEKSLGHTHRLDFLNSTIAGVYLATDQAMTGSVSISYNSFRIVDDIAPDRNLVSYSRAGLGTGFGWNEACQIPTAAQYLATSGNTLRISLKVEGEVGSSFSMNFAGNDNTILKQIVITVTETGLTSNCGKLVKAPDDFYDFYLSNTECDPDGVANINPGTLIAVFWMGGEFTCSRVTFDTYSLKVYQAGIVA